MIMHHFNLSLIKKSLLIASISLCAPMIEAEETATSTTPTTENPQINTIVEQAPPDSASHLSMSQAAITTLAQSTPKAKNNAQFPRYSTALQQALNQKDQTHLDIMLYSQPKQQKQLLAWLNKNKVKIQSQTTEYIFVKLTPQQLMNATLAQHRALKSADLQAQLVVPVVTNQTEITQPTTLEKQPTTAQESIPAPVNLCAKQNLNPTEKCVQTELDASGEVISQTAMSLAILDSLSKHNKKQNLVFSPQSLAESGLALLLASSKPTQLVRPTWFLPQFQNTSQFEQLHLATYSPSYQSWNQTWYNQQAKVQTKFVEQYQRILHGSIQTIDFNNAQQAAALINQDIAEKTKQHITQLLDATDVQNAQVVLTNAAYFKAQWQMPFEDYKTALQTFKNANQKTVSVATMNNTLSVSSAQAQNWTMVNLPFHDGQTLLSLLLPPEKTPLALPTTQVLYKLDQAQQTQKIDLALPKIKLTGDKINLTQLFPNISTWQLDQLLIDDQVKQLKGLHQATIEWDEQGAEAAAATAVIGKRSLAANIPQISFNRPFVFLVRDQKQVLFSGVVRQLEAAKTAVKEETTPIKTPTTAPSAIEPTTVTSTPEDHSHH